MTSDPQSERDRELRAILVAKATAEGSISHRRHNPWMVGIAGVVAVAALTGAAVATSSIVTTFHEIPHSTHRAPDPVVTQGPSTVAPDTGSVSAQDAPLAQLWAISKGDPIPADQSNPLAWQLDDFASAIRSRCYPQLSAADQAQLTALYAAFTRALEQRPLDVPAVRDAKNAYFDRTTKLCM